MVTLDNTSVHSFLPHINSLLHNAVLTCTSAMSTDTLVQQFQSDKIAPNKKMEHQWRFQKTTKPPGRKKKGLILRSAHKVMRIKNNVLNSIDMQTRKRGSTSWMN